MLRRSRSAPAVLTLLATLLLAAPVAAQSGPSARRDAAEDALAEAQRLAEGKGVRTGRELSAALFALSARRSSLDQGDRAEADRLLLRPTSTGGDGITAPYSSAARVWRNCSEHFCIHWVDSTTDAPSLASDDECPATPDYIDEMRRAFEQSYDVENTRLAWLGPVPDGTRGGDSRTDVYVKDIGADGTYGYAATDRGQATRSKFAFQVMDDDYAEFGYPDPNDPLRVTAAHEYNHILQYRYDALADTWMFESTATWAEDMVFDAIDDWHQYMTNWAARPFQPLTYEGDGVSPFNDDRKMYGSAIWNHWIDRTYGPDAVLRAWQLSQSAGGFAPESYDRAIKNDNTPGAGFAREFAEFAAATAEWKQTDSGIREGSTFPDVKHGPLPLPAAPPFTIDHTAYKLFDVPLDGPGPDVRIDASLLKSGAPVAGSVALVGRTAAGEVTKVLDEFDSAGEASVTLENVADYQRVTAVLVNADYRATGSSPDNWTWTADGAQATLTASGLDALPSGDVEEETAASPSPPAPAITYCGETTVEREPAVTPTPTATPAPSTTPVPTVTPTPTVTPPVATSLRLTRNSSRIGSVLRKGVLSLFAQANKAGRHSARATVDRATAKRLRVGRRTTTAGRGRRTASAPAKLKVNVKLTRKLRAALKRHRKRSVKVKVAVTFMPADGTAAVRKTLAIRLRP